jgi:hypothetical protein
MEFGCEVQHWKEKIIKMKLLIQDNFFNFPEYLVMMSKKLDYQKEEKIYGLRTKCLSLINKNVYDFCCKKIITSFTGIKNFEFQAHAHLHFHTKSDENDIYYANGKEHLDPCLFTGMVYLSKNPPTGTGTIMYDNDLENDIVIENKFNRAIIFDSNKTFHSAGKFFGNSLETSRLTLVCFVEKIFDKNEKKWYK